MSATTAKPDPLSGLSIFFVGMMGAGKSTVARQVARLLDYRCFDTDELIVRSTDRAIAQLFADLGEAGFRDLETKVLEQTAALTRSAIATGGGIVLRQENWSYLQQGLVVWLDVPVEVLLARLRRDQTRPLLQTPDPEATVRELLAARRSRYELADLHVAVRAADSPREVAARVVAQLPSVRKSSSG